MLKPCPFCGSENVEVHEDDKGFASYVWCFECGADGPPIDYKFSGTKEESLKIVTDQWNKRA